MFKVPYALITGGGTMVSVDAMRSMSNRAEGDFALSFAYQFSRRGIPVVLILSRLAYLKHRMNIPKNTEVIQFTTFTEYLEALERAVAVFGRPGYAMSTAAVSDYGFEKPVEGKISSDQEVLHLEIPKLPKVLDTWRERFGITCLIVGFKLLSSKNSSLSDVIAAARKQNRRAHLNATIANLAEEIGSGAHPIWWVTPDGGVVRIDGHRDDVAAQITKIMVRYHSTHWHKSVRMGDVLPVLEGRDEMQRYVRDLVAFSQQTGLLHDASGNLAVTLDRNRLIVSPRGVDKTNLQIGDLMVAKFGESGTREVHFWGPEGSKPSIDTSVHLYGLADLPHAASIHFHDGWVLGNLPKTRISYPCGTLEQAMSIREAIARARHSPTMCFGTESFMLELTNHGHILYLLTFRYLTSLMQAWSGIVAEYRQHLCDIGHPEFIKMVSLEPVFWMGGIYGVVAKTKTEGWHSFYLNQAARGRGLGRQLIELINQRGVLVAAHDNCSVKEFYQAHGFHTVERREEEGLTVLEPPTQRKDLRAAATLCIYCTTTDKVLLIERGNTFYPGYFAHVGGGIDPGDPDALSAAIREASEEVGADLTGLPEPEDSDVSIHYTGWVKPSTGEERAYRVTNILVRVLVEFDTHPDGQEIVSAGWYSREQMSLLKMGHATKEALRKVWP